MTSGARFTPSLLDANTLEQLFVNRHHQLDDAMGRIQRAAATDERAAKLFVGPRGAGKTHLISLVYHRARAMPGFGTQFQLAWLPEDLWTISSFDDLAAEIVESVEPPLDTNGDPVSAIVAAARDRGPIVVLLENLDSVFHALGSEGQRRLRALLENHRSLLLITTSTRLGDDLLDQAEPFYGFFDTTILEPFDIDEAASMLKRIAELDGSTELAARLDEPMARNRLATIAHLAGGQPRVWALLAAGLTIDRLDDLVSVLVERFDDLTPYYQQQLERLSLNERKAVRALAAADGTLTVAELAHLTGIDPRSMAKTITDLRRRGWVTRRTGLLTELGDKRRSYYELAEPLARLAFQLKESRGRPVKLVVEFLKTWFDHEDLAGDEAASEIVTRYRDAAHQSLLTDAPLAVAKALAGQGTRPTIAWTTDPTASLFHPDPMAGLNTLAQAVLLDLDDALAAYEAGDPEPLLRQPPVVSQLIERQLTQASTAEQRLTLAGLGLDGDSSEQWVSRLEGVSSSLTGALRTAAIGMLALHQLRLAHHGPADLLLNQAAASASEEDAPVLLWTGLRLLEAHEPARARSMLEAAMPKMRSQDQLAVNVALEATYLRCGVAGDVVGLWKRALSVVTSALGPDHPDTLISRNNLANAYRMAGNLEHAIELHKATLADFERILGPEDPSTLTSRDNLANAYQTGGNPERALPLYESTLADRERVLGPDHPSTLTSRNNVASAYQTAGQPERAIPLFESILADRERVLGPNHVGTLTSRNNLAYAYGSVENLERAIPIYEATLASFEIVLGSSHPDTLTSRSNLASAYQRIGRLDDATRLVEATLADRERVLGASHPDTLVSRNNLAGALELAGDLDRATPLLEDTLKDSERVLGPDHPSTLTVQGNLASAYVSGGNLEQGVPLYEAALAAHERILGPHHPQTSAIRQQLTRAKDPVQARPLFEANSVDPDRHSRANIQGGPADGP